MCFMSKMIGKIDYIFLVRPLPLQNSLNSQIAKGSETCLEPSHTYMVKVSSKVFNGF